MGPILPNKKCPREVRLCGSPSSLAVCEMVPAAQPGTSDLEIAKDRGPAEGCMKPKPDFSAHLHGQIESLDQGGWTSCRQTGEVVFPFHPSENYLLTTAHILGLKLPFPSPLKNIIKNTSSYAEFKYETKEEKFPLWNNVYLVLMDFSAMFALHSFHGTGKATLYRASPSLWTHILLACCFQFAG